MTTTKPCLCPHQYMLLSIRSSQHQTTNPHKVPPPSLMPVVRLNLLPVTNNSGSSATHIKQKHVDSPSFLIKVSNGYDIFVIGLHKDTNMYARDIWSNNAGVSIEKPKSPQQIWQYHCYASVRIPSLFLYHTNDMSCTWDKQLCQCANTCLVTTYHRLWKSWEKPEQRWFKEMSIFAFVYSCIMQCSLFV